MNQKLQRIIILNHLIIAIAATLVSVYVWLFEGFITGKGYMPLIVAAIFGWLYYKNRKR